MSHFLEKAQYRVAMNQNDYGGILKIKLFRLKA